MLFDSWVHMMFASVNDRLSDRIPVRVSSGLVTSTKLISCKTCRLFYIQQNALLSYIEVDNNLILGRSTRGIGRYDYI